MASFAISLRDVVELNDSRIGRVRYIGQNGFKSTVYYGIHLKEKKNKDDLYFELNSRPYFNCPGDHGIFVKASDIKRIIKKHTVSASFSYNQKVRVKNIGKGTIKYIGLTHYGSNYWFGVELEQTIIRIRTNSDNKCIYYLSQNEINTYFDCDYKKSIFVRGNQLRSVDSLKPKAKGITINQMKNSGVSRYDEYINKTLLSMMNSLDIPQTARPTLMAMDSAKKVLLIQQWFVNSKNSNECPAVSVHDNVSAMESEEIKPKPQNNIFPISAQLPPITNNIDPLTPFDGCDINNNGKSKRKNDRSRNKQSNKNEPFDISVSNSDFPTTFKEENVKRKKIKKKPIKPEKKLKKKSTSKSNKKAMFNKAKSIKLRNKSVNNVRYQKTIQKSGKSKKATKSVKKVQNKSKAKKAKKSVNKTKNKSNTKKSKKAKKSVKNVQNKSKAKKAKKSVNKTKNKSNTKKSKKTKKGMKSVKSKNNKNDNVIKPKGRIRNSNKKRKNKQ